jgi:Tol biopolymer transport system component
VSTRPDRASTWAPPTPVTSLNTPDDDSSPGIYLDGLMIFNSQRNGTADLFSARPATATTWMTPQPITELNTTTHEETAGRLWDSSRQIVFAADATGVSWNLYIAKRPTAADAFIGTAELTELSTTGIEWDPWISEDGRYLMFDSDRTGDYEIYETSR